MSTILRGSDDFDSLEGAGVGFNQTWQDVTGSRSSGVTYTNNTGKSIAINVHGGLNVSEFIEITVGETNVAYVTEDSASASIRFASAIIPSGSTYKYTTNGNGSLSVFELREVI